MARESWSWLHVLYTKPKPNPNCVFCVDVLWVSYMYYILSLAWLLELIHPLPSLSLSSLSLSLSLGGGVGGSVLVATPDGVRSSGRPRLRLGLRLKLGGGGGGSVLVATPDSVHSICIELQLSLATTSYPHPS